MNLRHKNKVKISVVKWLLFFILSHTSLFLGAQVENQISTDLQTDYNLLHRDDLKNVINDVESLSLAETDSEENKIPEEEDNDAEEDIENENQQDDDCQSALVTQEIDTIVLSNFYKADKNAQKNIRINSIPIYLWNCSFKIPLLS